MNPAYRHARLRAALPHGSLPESFAVITACNPEGKTIPQADNDERTRRFQAQLASLGLDHFPVTGFDLKSPHEEAGFAVGDREASEPLAALEPGQGDVFHHLPPG